MNLHSVFVDFVNFVEPQLSQINLLFDEWTPHDGPNHIKSLKRIADELLKDRIELLNGVEACVLACSLYGHDWGMAVSEDEKAVIVTGKTRVGRATHSFALLQDELSRWKLFANEMGLSIDDKGHLHNEGDLSKQVWREYVRRTHAERSRARSLSYFVGDIAHLGEPIGEVCAGHWYDISEIRRIPKTTSVAGNVVNLRALAVYMRFIDLLDIGGNRTPYSLWKFVTPQDPVSKIEWGKHKSLDVIVIDEPADESRPRVLKIYGKTDDYRVYAALQDFRGYCKRQIEENTAVLEELGNFFLGTISLDWNVKALGFEPIDIRFEFDRTQMFNLVSSEIYDGDPYVFLRELLQNATDASVLRKARYKADQGASPGEQIIRIGIETDIDGNASVAVSDDGTGMSVQIVKDYLATIGRSYYRSSEFNNLDLSFMPISRFGVGLLSCFEVADAISIKTRQDSKFGPSVGLLIEIGKKTDQFRISKLDDVNCPIGTTVIVHLLKRKWPSENFDEAIGLAAADYVTAIAGYCPLPIHIDENGTESVVLSAGSTSEEQDFATKLFPDAALVIQSTGDALTEVVAIQDQRKAELVFEAKQCSFSSSVDGVRVTGTVTYFTPKEEVQWSTRLRGLGEGVRACLHNGNHVEVRWRGPNSPKPTCLGPSAAKSQNCDVFLQGIRLPGLDLFPSWGSSLGAPPPQISVNIEPVTTSLIPVLSRKSVRGPTDALKEAIEVALSNEIQKEFNDSFKFGTLEERLLLLVRLARYRIPDPQGCFPQSEWPIPVFHNDGSLFLKKLADLPSEIETCALSMMREKRFTGGIWPIQNWLKTPRLHGEHILRRDVETCAINSGFDYDDGSPMEWNTMDGLVSSAIRANFEEVKIRTVLVDGIEYIFTEWQRKEVNPPAAALHFSSFGPMFMPFIGTAENDVCILPLDNSQMGERHLRGACFNLNHPCGVILQSAYEAYQNASSELNPIIAGELSDTFNSLGLWGFSFNNYHSGHFEQLIPGWLRSFCLAINQHKLIELTDVQKAELSTTMTTRLVFT